MVDFQSADDASVEPCSSQVCCIVFDGVRVVNGQSSLHKSAKVHVLVGINVLNTFNSRVHCGLTVKDRLSSY